MAFDLDKLKQRFLTRADKQNMSADKPGEQVMTDSTAPTKNTSSNPKVEALKQGFADIKSVAEEGNYKLFVKQLVLVLCVFLGVRFLVGKLATQKAQILDRSSAISIQQAHEDDYMANKELLLRLEPLFPDKKKKNEWLIQNLMKIFSEHLVQADINGNATEKKENNYTVVSQEVSMKMSFADVGKMLADVESGDSFLRISNISISKMTDPNSLGLNTVTMRFNTLFPKEKFAKRLFKDYDKQMKKLKGETATSDEEEKNTEGQEKKAGASSTTSATQGGANAL